ncbi:methyl-CpG-binding domain protein 5-like [Saccoglossus kowalevskii]|uniref:Methyl-CpG-binding domain protein 5-like n=1 Tax=Saccoglossus kowalevskii TaxID=10224 RepID=A0ABM0MPM7_SACKO|nr:PREDICTED: methyl-CpG-binding domain protein 5-like [Saccoglossus kowalevskii]
MKVEKKEPPESDFDTKHTEFVKVPFGWQRLIENGKIVYVSPNQSLLTSLDHVKEYMQTDGTCKCGLECPLLVDIVFNFDISLLSTQRTAEDLKQDNALTNLCNHKRKILAMASLQSSVEKPPRRSCLSHANLKIDTQVPVKVTKKGILCYKHLINILSLSPHSSCFHESC